MCLFFATVWVIEPLAKQIEWTFRSHCVCLSPIADGGAGGAGTSQFFVLVFFMSEMCFFPLSLGKTGAMLAGSLTSPLFFASSWCQGTSNIPN